MSGRLAEYKRTLFDFYVSTWGEDEHVHKWLYGGVAMERETWDAQISVELDEIPFAQWFYENERALTLDGMKSCREMMGVLRKVRRGKTKLDTDSQVLLESCLLDEEEELIELLDRMGMISTWEIEAKRTGKLVYEPSA